MENAKKVILGGKTQSQVRRHPFSLSCDGCWLGAVTSKESSYSGTMEEVWGAASLQNEEVGLKRTGSRTDTSVETIWGGKSFWS